MGNIKINKKFSEEYKEERTVKLPILSLHHWSILDFWKFIWSPSKNLLCYT